MLRRSVLQESNLPLKVTVHYKSDETLNFCGFRCATTSPITVFINFVFYIYYQVWSATEAHVGRPTSRAPLHGSRLTVPVFTIFYIRVVSPLTFHFCSENIIHKKPVAPWTLMSCKLSVKCLSSTVNPIVAEEVYDYVIPELRATSSIAKNIYSPFQ